MYHLCWGHHRVWKSAFGNWDLNKIWSGIQENARYLNRGNRISQIPGKQDSPNFQHGMQDFFACTLGIQEIIIMFEQQSDQEPISCSNQTTECVLLTSFYCIVSGNKKRIWESTEKSEAYGIFVKKEQEYRIRTSLPDTDITHRDAQQS